MRRLNLKNRRGVFVVIFGIMFLGLMAAAAVSIDMTRTWSFRNELQTAADAAALAGAVQLASKGLDPLQYETAARDFAGHNRVLTDTVTVDSVTLGYWDDSVAVFTAGPPPGLPGNAVRTVVSHAATGIWSRGLLGVAGYKVRARAIAWADAGVTTSNGCIRPWAIPYQALLARVNPLRGIANDSAGLTRDFTPEDRALLDTMNVADRTFTLKLGSNTLSDFGDVTTYPGNYQAVELPRKYLDDGITPNPEYSAGGGARDYEASVAGVNCHALKVGDILGTEPGNKVGPTVDGADASEGVQYAGVGPCDELLGNSNGDGFKNKTDDPQFGNCLDVDGTPGVDIKAAFFLCNATCNGRAEVTVHMLGSFTLMKVYPSDSKNGDPVDFSKADIVGVFHPLMDTGAVGPGASTLRKIILVECQAGRHGTAPTPCT